MHRTPYFAAWIFVLLLACSPALAVPFDDGASHVIDAANSFPFENVDVFDGAGGATTTVDLVAGGQIGTGIPIATFTGNDSSLLNISGGTVNGNVQGFDCATVNFSGGTTGQVRSDGGSVANVSGGTVFSVRSGPGGNVNITGGMITNVSSALSGEVDLAGGTILGALVAEGPGAIWMSGGTVALGASVNGTGEIAISGGSVSGQILAEENDGARVLIMGGTHPSANLLALDGGTIELQGSGFNFPLGDIAVTSGTVVGTLADGSPLDIPFGRASTATIRLAAYAPPICTGGLPCAPLIPNEIVFAATLEDDGSRISDTSIEVYDSGLVHQRYLLGPFDSGGPIVNLGTDLEVDGSGRIYFVKGTELVRLDPTSGQEERLVCNGAITRFELHPNGKIYATQGLELLELDPVTGARSVLAVLPEAGTSIAVEDDGNLLVATPSELHRVILPAGIVSPILALSFMGSGPGDFGPPIVEVAGGQIFLGGTKTQAASTFQAAAVWYFDGSTVTEVAAYDGQSSSPGRNYQIRDMEADPSGDLILVSRVPQPGCETTCTELRNKLIRLDPFTGNSVEGAEIIKGSVGTLFAGHAIRHPAACADGVDNDGDGLGDFPLDPGCSGAGDSSEQDASLPCDDGVDNDGDTLVDLMDPACKDPTWTRENAQCQDGLNNDGLVGVDFDGGESIWGSPVDVPDPQCASFWDNREGGNTWSCGIGPEVALLLPLLAWARTRRRRPESL